LLYSKEELGVAIGQIYDCAIDPQLWAPTLTAIRDKMDMAYVHVNLLDRTFYLQGPNTKPGVFQSKWDQQWMHKLPRLLIDVPAMERWAAQDIDDSISQMQCVSEPDFHQSEFYLQWVKPQGLRDYCYTTVAKRTHLTGSVGAATYASRGLVTEAERGTFRMFAPHFRRALLISGMLDEGKLQF
jgi:hypothetical protein